ncbi:MAG TPA: ABC transporter permease [Acidimicrobiales bacterium]|jgi:ABC-2 type transport system permease protein|nr:ABC transporter permease [Acidimicrobiales bacterium]
MATESMDLRTAGATVALRSRVGDILRYRELIVALIRKELRVRYKNSVLGFVWSLVNPAVTIGVFYVLFSLVLNNSIPYFVLFLMSGVLVWNMFNNGLAASVGSIVGNAPLVKKVWFPREIFPLVAVGAAFIDFLIQSSVLVVAFAAMRWRIGWSYLPLIPLALIAALLFTTALALWLAAVNVRYRDMQHFLGIALMVWFWGTPIIYPFEQVAHKLSSHGLSWLPLLNPYAIVTLSFQRALYNRTSVHTSRTTITPMMPNHGELWYVALLGLLILVSIVLGLGAWHVFRRLEGDFAEEL